MNVVDSSGWLELLTNGQNKTPFVEVVRNTQALIVPALVHFEVIKRARTLFDEDFAARIEALLGDGIYIEVTRAIVEHVIDVSIAHKLATADSLIYATALEYEATLWTQDKHFQGLPGVEYFEKQG